MYTAYFPSGGWCTTWSALSSCIWIFQATFHGYVCYKFQRDSRNGCRRWCNHQQTARCAYFPFPFALSRYVMVARSAIRSDINIQNHFLNIKIDSPKLFSIRRHLQEWKNEPLCERCHPVRLEKKNREKCCTWKYTRGRKNLENFPAVRQLSAARIKDGDRFQPLLSAPSNSICMYVCMDKLKGGRCVCGTCTCTRRRTPFYVTHYVPNIIIPAVYNAAHVYTWWSLGFRDLISHLLSLSLWLGFFFFY